MADTKISALTDGAPAQGTEDVPVALSGSNYRLTTGDIALLVLQEAFTGAITVNAATTGALAGSPTYANGAAGVGATLTRGSNGVFPTIDGIAAALNNTYLVKNQATQTQNGVYTLSTLGSGAAAWVLTRTTDSDEPSELNAQIVIVGAGTTNKRRLYSQTTATPTIGTNNIVYAQTPAPNMSEYVKRDGTVNFIGIETWDFGGTDTTVISDSAVSVSGGALQGLLQKDLVQISNGLGGQGVLSETIVGVTNASGDSTAITAGTLTTLMASGGTFEKKFIKVSLSAAQVKSLLTTPVECVATPGPGKAIIPVCCMAVYTAGAVAFANEQVKLVFDTSNPAQFCLNTGGGFLSNVSSDIHRMFDIDSSNYDHPIILADQPLMAISDTDSATGDGTVDLYIEYNIITL